MAAGIGMSSGVGVRVTSIAPALEQSQRTQQSSVPTASLTPVSRPVIVTTHSGDVNRLGSLALEKGRSLLIYIGDGLGGGGDQRDSTSKRRCGLNSLPVRKPPPPVLPPSPKAPNQCQIDCWGQRKVSLYPPATQNSRLDFTVYLFPHGPLGAGIRPRKDCSSSRIWGPVQTHQRASPVFSMLGLVYTVGRVPRRPQNLNIHTRIPTSPSLSPSFLRQGNRVTHASLQSFK